MSAPPCVPHCSSTLPSTDTTTSAISTSTTTPPKETSSDSSTASTDSSTQADTTTPDSGSSPTSTYSSTYSSTYPSTIPSTAAGATTASSTTSPLVQAQASTSGSSSNTGAIVGGIFGGIVFLLCVAFGAFLYIRRRRRKRMAPSSEFINSLKPGIEPVFRLETGVSSAPEKSALSRYLNTPPPPPPFTPDPYYASPTASSMGFPESATFPDRPSASLSAERPLEPNRYSAQHAAAAASSHDGHAVDDDDRGSGQWDGDPIIETPTTRRARTRRPESAPASTPRPPSSQRRTHQWPQHSFPGVSPLAMRQTAGDRDGPDSPAAQQRATSLRPLRRGDHWDPTTHII
ncbi:hypothetical protein ID866_7569 [Astraeus odoratus]|nr:hypothetical protein ID866_7569 [Astraeus odoratus]